MTKKVYRYFGGFIDRQTKWLNQMAADGWRLIHTGKLIYEFEHCSPEKYQYAVEFIAEKSQKSAESYKFFLEGCGYTVFYKNANLNYSVGKVRWRPWAEPGGRITTNRTTFNRELLIVEKENDGKPFQLHTTIPDRIAYYKKWRNLWLTYVIMFVLMGIAFMPITPTASALLYLIGFLVFVPVILYQTQLRKLKKEEQLEE